MNKLIVLIVAIGFVAVGNAMNPTGPQIRSVRLQKQQLAGNFCQGCRSMVSFMTNFNSSSNREASKEALKSYCELYYPVSTDFRQGPCPMFVENLFYLMGQIDPSHHCDNIGACEMSLSNVQVSNNAIKPMPGGGVFCNVCEQVVTQIQGELEDPSTIELIHRQVDSFCDYLIVIDQNKACKQMVDNYIDQAIDFVKHLEPLKYCQSIAMCDVTKKPSVQQLNSLAHFHEFGLETKVTLDGKVVKDIDTVRPIKPRKQLQKGPNCQFCKMFVKEMFKFLKDNRTEENVRLGLDKICGLIYRKKQNELEHCEMLVHSYTHEIVQILVDETDPELICMLLDQCTYQNDVQKFMDEFTLSPLEQVKEWSKKIESNVQPIDMNIFVSMLDSDIKLGSSRTCLECKLFIEYLQNQIKDVKSQEEIKQWLLNNLCATLEEKTLKDSCDQLIERYAEIFFKAVSNELNPKETCQELNACKKQKLISLIFDTSATNENVDKHHKQVTTNVVAAPTSPAPRNSVCDQCVSIITQIDEYLANHSVDHDSTVLIDEVCNKLPNDSLKQECTLLVRTLGDEIAQAVATMDNPKQLCSKIYLC